MTPPYPKSVQLARANRTAKPRHGGPNRHDLLIGLTRLRQELRDADDQLREYATERSHGATANAEYLDRCAAAARFHLTHALSLGPNGDRRDG